MRRFKVVLFVRKAIFRNETRIWFHTNPRLLAIPNKKTPAESPLTAVHRSFCGFNLELGELDRPGERNILGAPDHSGTFDTGRGRSSIFRASGIPPDPRHLIHRRSPSSPALIRRITSAIIRRRPRHTDQATFNEVVAVLYLLPTLKPPSGAEKGARISARTSKVGLASGWITNSNPDETS